MALFEVGQPWFEDLTGFNAYLAKMDPGEFNQELYIVIGLSQFPKDEFYTILREMGYTFEDFGSIMKISRFLGEPNESDDGEEEESRESSKRHSQ